MKKSLFAAIFAIAAMVLSALATPCRAQVINPERMEEFEKNNVLPVAEQMPEFPGGTVALMNFLAYNIKYPADAHEEKAEGRAIIKFVVNADGSVSNISVAKSTGNESLDKEAMRVVSLMPKWKPGTQGGKNVNVRFAVPIAFRLQ